MREDFEKLLAKIMARIREEERLISVKKRLILFSVSVIASAGAFIPAFNIFRREFVGSGFYQYLSLPFYDSGFVMTSWRDFGFALLESLPAMSIAVILASALVFLWSFKHLAKTIKYGYGL